MDREASLQVSQQWVMIKCSISYYGNTIIEVQKNQYHTKKEVLSIRSMSLIMWVGITL